MSCQVVRISLLLSDVQCLELVLTFLFVLILLGDCLFPVVLVPGDDFSEAFTVFFFCFLALEIDGFC